MDTIKLKPGQLCTIKTQLYRAHRRIDVFCTGCDLNNVFICPNVRNYMFSNQRPIACDSCGIILKRVRI